MSETGRRIEIDLTDAMIAAAASELSLYVSAMGFWDTCSADAVEEPAKKILSAALLDDFSG